MKNILPLIVLCSLPISAYAVTVDLTLSTSWTAGDYDVSSTGPVGSTAAEADDDKVFGIAPSVGSLSLTLRVDTTGASSYAAGVGGRLNDFFGYTNVSIVGGSFSYGSATWNDADILTGLIGPEGDTAALWTDTDLETGAPSLVSFRMISSWFDANADIFFGSRSALVAGDAISINDDFYLAEYFGGENISLSNNGYTATVSSSVVPLPAGGLLLLTGAGALVLLRRKRKAN